MLDPVLRAYDEAWNAREAGARSALLERALGSDAELVDPAGGVFRGLDAIGARIGGFAERFPGAEVKITSGVDEHHGFARYAWTITDAGGQAIANGIDVVERARDGRIRRVVMFFGDLPAPQN